MARSGRKSGGTREALIRAGRRLFTRYGYDGTSVRAITEAADANLGAITYHFGSKRVLYGAVVESVVSPLAGRVERAAAGPGDPLERVEAVVRAFFAFFEETPEMPRLMLQGLAVGREPPAEALAVVRRMVTAVRAVITEGQASGQIREGDAALFGLSIVSQPVHAAMARPMFARVLGSGFRDAAAQARLVEHAVAFVRGGLMAKERT